MELQVDGRLIRMTPTLVVVAGFTGRDSAEVRRHIAELADQGIDAPEKVPSFYLLPPSAVSQGTSVEVDHEATSGEAEIALIGLDDRWFVSIASDHTDRRAEAVDIGLAKRKCPKVFGTVAWRYEEVAERWDTLELRSWILDGGERVLYQAGTASELLAPTQLLSHLDGGKPPSDFAMLMGTVPVRGGIRGSSHFWSELRDPATGRTITLEYAVAVMTKPVMSG